MCFGGGQPKPPVNKPTYTPAQANQFFDISMKNEETGEEKDLDGRSEKANRKATGLNF